MKCNRLRLVASRLVDALPFYARSMPFFVKNKFTPKRSRKTFTQFSMREKREKRGVGDDRIKNTEVRGGVVWEGNQKFPNSSRSFCSCCGAGVRNAEVQMHRPGSGFQTPYLFVTAIFRNSDEFRVIVPTFRQKDSIFFLETPMLVPMLLLDMPMLVDLRRIPELRCMHLP